MEEKDKGIKKEIEKEIDIIWENELKDKFVKLLDSNFQTISNEVEKKLDMNAKEVAKNIEKLVNILKPVDIKTKMNRYCTNIIYENNTNYLVNLVLICLSNIEPLVFFCLGNKNEILEKIREKDNLFSLLKELFNNVWLNKNNFNPNRLHNKLKQLNNQKYSSKDPGAIFYFILSKLNDELQFNKNINNNNNINIYSKEEVFNNFKEMIERNKTQISDIFFVNYQIKKTCRICEAESYFCEQKPIINLYIEQQVQNSVVKRGQFQDISLNDNFNFLLNDNIDIEEDCGICECKQSFKINNLIKGLNNNILIINLDRVKDSLHERNVDIPKQLKLKLQNETKFYEIIAVINRNIPLKEEYNAYCKNFFDNKWYVYNNKNVKMENNENEIFNGHKALLLIYKKIINNN